MVVDEKTDFREIARDGGTVLSYRAGDFIFREGDTAGFMYIVLKGSVEVSTRDKLVVTIPEGKPFGMLSLIDKSLGPTPLAPKRMRTGASRRADLPCHGRGDAGFPLVRDQ